MKLSSRTEANWELIFLGFATFMFLLSEAGIADGKSSAVELTRMSFIGLIAAPCVIPLIIM